MHLSTHSVDVIRMSLTVNIYHFSEQVCRSVFHMEQDCAFCTADTGFCM